MIEHLSASIMYDAVSINLLEFKKSYPSLVHCTLQKPRDATEGIKY